MILWDGTTQMVNTLIVNGIHRETAAVAMQVIILIMEKRLVRLAARVEVV